MQPEFKPGDPAPWPLPSFVRCTEHVDELSGYPFDCWVPDVTGHPPTDYRTGEQHCLAALALVREFNNTTLLISILIAMQRKNRGAMETGFLDMLARKAAAGATPPDLQDDAQFQADEDFRCAEGIADIYLELAREKDGHVTMSCLLSDFMEGDLGEVSGAYLAKICGAAMNAGLN